MIELMIMITFDDHHHRDDDDDGCERKKLKQSTDMEC